MLMSAASDWHVNVSSQWMEC